MNIFVTDHCPIRAAENLDDKRVVKMVLESTQMLSNACGGPYKPTHVHHPCSIWVKADERNYAWLYDHAIHLADMYHAIYGKPHACMDILFGLRRPTTEATPASWQNSARNKEKGLDFSGMHPIFAYREYLKARWATDVRQPTWRGRTPPEWLSPQALERAALQASRTAEGTGLACRS